MRLWRSTVSSCLFASLPIPSTACRYEAAAGNLNLVTIWGVAAILSRCVDARAARSIALGSCFPLALSI